MSNSKVFDVVPMETPERNSFDLSHYHATSIDMGRLYPISLMECIPGDRVTIGAEALVRFAPMIAPVMQSFYCTLHYFFVPYRLLWDKWTEWIKSQPGAAGVPAFPTLTINQTNYNTYATLMNHMGIPIPPDNVNTETVNAMPFAAYQLIYNEYYRDQNLVAPITSALVNGDNAANIANLCNIRRRAWKRDYFTSCLPFAQKGDPVTLPVGEFNDLPVMVRDTDNSVLSHKVDAERLPLGGAVEDFYLRDNNTEFDDKQLHVNTSDLSAEAININDLREAEAIQKWLETNARGGTRYNEFISAHFGVKSSDARLQRPEYITGIKQNVLISEVLNTTGTADAPQGNMAGHGVGVIDDGNFGSFYCEEHGLIMGIMSVLPETCYQQGLDKIWLKTEDPTQYYFPAFKNLGEQPVKKKEIYAFSATGDDTFGYLPYATDYRFISNKTTGEFQTDLSYWTATRIFSSAPSLNQTFIEAIPRKDIFAVEDLESNCLYVHVNNKIFMSRLIPVYSIPSLT